MSDSPCSFELSHRSSEAGEHSLSSESECVAIGPRAARQEAKDEDATSPRVTTRSCLSRLSGLKLNTSRRRASANGAPGTCGGGIISSLTTLRANCFPAQGCTLTNRCLLESDHELLHLIIIIAPRCLRSTKPHPPDTSSSAKSARNRWLRPFLRNDMCQTSTEYSIPRTGSYRPMRNRTSIDAWTGQQKSNVIKKSKAINTPMALRP